MHQDLDNVVLDYSFSSLGLPDVQVLLNLVVVRLQGNSTLDTPIVDGSLSHFDGKSECPLLSASHATISELITKVFEHVERVLNLKILLV